MGKLKRIICILIVFISSASVLAGCALFQVDKERYNNLPVATVGGIVVTKKQLIDGFNNWGYQYEQDYDYDREEALDQTLTMLIDREVMVNLALEELYGKTEAAITQSRKNNKDFPYNFLTEKEKDAARKNAYDSLNKSYKAIEDEVRQSHNMTVNETASEETPSDTTHDTYQPYTPILTKVTVERERPVKDSNGTLSVSNGQVQMEKYWDTTYRIDVSNFYQENNVGYVAPAWTPKTRVNNPQGAEKKIADEAYGSLVRRLKNNETGLSFEEDKDKNGKKKETAEINKNVIAREIQRMCIEEAKSTLVGKFRDLFEQGLSKPIDKVNGVYEGVPYATLVAAYGEEGAYEFAVSSMNSNYTENLAKRAEEYYKRQVRSQIDKYKKQQETDESIGTKLLDSLSEVKYVPESIMNKYFSVSHILIGYSEEQQEELSQIEAKKKTGGNTSDYETSLNALRARAGGFMRNEKGEEIGKFMTAEQILQYVQNYVMPYDKSKDKEYTSGASGTGYVRDIESIRNAFRDCIYMFNTDPGMMNAEFEYVIGLDDSRMVEEFTKASRDLYWNADKNRQEGKVGGMSGLVWTQFGAHIIMYTRNISDFIYHNSSSLIENTFARYMNATQTSYGNKTYFDSIIETLNNPDYETHEQNLIKGYLEGRTIKIIKKNYKDIYK